MTYQRATWLPDVLRDAGLTVIEHDGWRTRGLSTARPFTPRAVVWHHDASAPGDSPGVPGYMIRNYDRAGAQLWVDRYGRWHIIASGRAAHAGKVLPGHPGNETSLGVETDHTTGEAWPDALLVSLRRGTAAILKHLGVPATRGLHFHKSICDPPGRKVDPDGLTLSTERLRVAAVKFTVKKSAATRVVELVQKIDNQWTKTRTVDRRLLSKLQWTGSPKWAKPADEAGDAIDAAMVKFLNHRNT